MKKKYLKNFFVWILVIALLTIEFDISALSIKAGTKKLNEKITENEEIVETEKLSAEQKELANKKEINADININVIQDTGLITPTEEQNRTADVDKNGTVDSGDALLILKYAAGLITEL